MMGKMMVQAKRVVYRKKSDLSNPFNWREVRLSLPGSKDYRPSLPWVIKCRENGHLASEVYLYADDGRCTGHNLNKCWVASRKFCLVCLYLGIQNAAEKRTFPLMTPRDWAGSVVHTTPSVVATITRER